MCSLLWWNRVLRSSLTPVAVISGVNRAAQEGNRLVIAAEAGSHDGSVAEYGGISWSELQRSPIRRVCGRPVPVVQLLDLAELDVALGRADRPLYAAKAAGRNQVGLGAAARHVGRIPGFLSFGLHRRAVDVAEHGLAALEPAEVARRLADAGHSEPQAAAGAALLWAFGTLIGNTDMHNGNLSFVSEHGQPPYYENADIAPAYDMTPMAFAPRSGGGLPDVLADTVIHASVSNSTWRHAEELARAGAEVVQLYVADTQASVARPPKELAAFAARWQDQPLILDKWYALQIAHAAPDRAAALALDLSQRPGFAFGNPNRFRAVFGALASWLMLGERLTLVALLGAAMMVASVILVQLRSDLRPAPQQA